VAKNVEVKIRILPGATAPSYATSGAAGADIVASVADDVCIAPGARALIPTGVFLEIPNGYMGEVRPRSGLALNHGVTVLNAPGTIDADYRGELKIILVNLGTEPFVVRSGDRIAQLVITSCESVAFLQSGLLSETGRGTGGFGSTGN
jgi:dUTP pyrophosphatase